MIPPNHLDEAPLLTHAEATKQARSRPCNECGAQIGEPCVGSRYVFADGSKNSCYGQPLTIEHTGRIVKEAQLMDEYTATWPPLSPGQRVRTLREVPAKGWSPEARQHCQWDAEGVVFRHSDSHGLCYGVRHPDTGQSAWYAPEELTNE